jgi:hypothetical protein
MTKSSPMIKSCLFRQLFLVVSANKGHLDFNSGPRTLAFKSAKVFLKKVEKFPVLTILLDVILQG